MSLTRLARVPSLRMRGTPGSAANVAVQVFGGNPGRRHRWAVIGAGIEEPHAPPARATTKMPGPVPRYAVLLVSACSCAPQARAGRAEPMATMSATQIESQIPTL
jgi:hypothetical protein